MEAPFDGPVRDLNESRRGASDMVGDLMMEEDEAEGAKERCSDVAIVGAGVAGAYAAHRLRKKYGEVVSVAVFERDWHVGGRLLSEAPPPPKPPSKTGKPAKQRGGATVQREFGAMRLFPGAMPRTTAVLEECGLDTTPVSTADANNLFYFEGECGTKTEFAVAGRTVRRLVAEAVRTFYRAHPEEEGADALQSERTRDMDFDTFLSTYGHLTAAQLRAVRAYSGYDLYDERVGVSNFLKLWPLYGSERADQLYVVGGYQELVTRLLRSAGRRVRSGREVREVARLADGTLELRFHGDPAPPPWRARHVVLTGTKGELEAVEKPASQAKRWQAMNAAAGLPLFKAFLPFDEPWWHELGLVAGKSTTDQQIRQVHYYDDRQLLVYCSGAAAAFWRSEFAKDPTGAARELIEQVRELHGVTRDMTGVPTSVDYHYWPDGSHKWKRDFDIAEAARKIAGLPAGGGSGGGGGGKKKSRLQGIDAKHKSSGNIWVVGDAFSSNQGWVEGALETVDKLMEVL